MHDGRSPSGTHMLPIRKGEHVPARQKKMNTSNHIKLDVAADLVMICTQISLSPFDAVTFNVVVVVSRLAGKPAFKVTATLGTPLMSPALIGKLTGWYAREPTLPSRGATMSHEFALLASPLQFF